MGDVLYGMMCSMIYSWDVPMLLISIIDVCVDYSLT